MAGGKVGGDGADEHRLLDVSATIFLQTSGVVARAITPLLQGTRHHETRTP